jgi:hypothetical protein
VPSKIHSIFLQGPRPERAALVINDFWLYVRCKRLAFSLD